MSIIQYNPFICVIDNVLTKQECEYYIDYFDKQYKLNKINFKTGEMRNYDQHIFTDDELAEQLFNRIEHIIPNKIKSKSRLNECFRMSKYHNGGVFNIHKDGINKSPKDGATTYMTLNIFLNDEFSGGETIFYDDKIGKKKTFIAKPTLGRACLFYSQQYHKGNTVITTNKKDGKYLLRTDLLLKL